VSPRDKLPPGTFGRYPVGLAYDLRMTATAIRVVLLIEQHQHPDFVSQDWLAVKLHTDQKAIWRAIRLALACGWLEVVERGRMMGRYGRTASTYRVLYPPRHDGTAAVMEDDTPSRQSCPLHDGNRGLSMTAPAPSHNQTHETRIMKSDETASVRSPETAARAARRRPRTPPACRKAGAHAAKTKTLLSEGWRPSYRNRQYARTCGLSEAEIDEQGEAFHDVMVADGIGQRDWNAAWNRWVRRELPRIEAHRVNGAMQHEAWQADEHDGSGNGGSPAGPCDAIAVPQAMLSKARSDADWTWWLAQRFPRNIDAWRAQLLDAAKADAAVAEYFLTEAAAHFAVLRWPPQTSPEFVCSLVVGLMCEALRNDERGRDAAKLRSLTTIEAGGSPC
jgi:hypothetical protein